jgi:hypothetical protein
VSKKFAKLFGGDDDQILVKVDSDDEANPEVRFYFVPPGLGVASVAVTFKYQDDASEEEAWRRADAFFERVDERIASEMRQNTLTQLFELGLPGGNAP